MLESIKKLCTPAMIYFLISMFILLVMIFTNHGNSKHFCMGEFECPVDNLYLIYIFKLGYLLIVTIILDSLCKNGYARLSWFILFLPILFFFILLGLFMIKQKSKRAYIQEEQ